MLTQRALWSESLCVALECLSFMRHFAQITFFFRVHRLWLALRQTQMKRSTWLQRTQKAVSIRFNWATRIVSWFRLDSNKPVLGSYRPATTNNHEKKKFRRRSDVESVWVWHWTHPIPPYVFECERQRNKTVTWILPAFCSTLSETISARTIERLLFCTGFRTRSTHNVLCGSYVCVSVCVSIHTYAVNSIRL